MSASRTSGRLQAPDAKWVIRFVVSAFVAGLLLARPALALELSGLNSDTPEQLNLNASPTGAAGSLPALYLYERPESSADGLKPGLMLYGGRLALDGGGLALTSDMYFGRAVQPADVLQAHGDAGADLPGVLRMGAASAADRHYVVQQDRALAQSLKYESKGLSLSGSYTSVGAGFQGLKELVASRPEVAGLKDALGTEKLDLQATFRPLPALGLQTGYTRFANDQPGHKERGLTTTHITQKLNLTSSSRVNLQGGWDLTEWEGLKEGSLNDLQLTGKFKLSQALGFNAAYHKIADDKPDSEKRGLTETKTHYDMAYALSGRTNLTAAYDTLESVLEKPDQRTVSESRTTRLGLAHQLSKATSLRIGSEFISTTKDGTALDTHVNSLHFEHKPSDRLGLMSDITRKDMSDGTVDNQTVFSLKSALGSGASATRIAGKFTRHVTGQDGAQTDTLTTLNLKSDPSPLLQLNVNYTGERREGPAATKDYTKTVATVTSRLTSQASIVTTLMRESDLGERLTSDRSVRLEFAPGMMKLKSRYQTVTRGSGEDEEELATDVFLEAGKPMRKWARQAGKKSVFAGVERFGTMTLAGWADMPEGGVTYEMIRRDHAAQDRTTTRRMGYQTMLGPGAYLRLAEQQYPVKKENDKTVILPIEERMLEGGVKLGGRFNLLARHLIHRDLEDDSRVDSSLLALRGTLGGADRFSFAGGVQRSEAAGARMAFADLNAKLGGPLAGWAKEASNKGVFDDHETYGHRNLPGWAQFTDGGLHFQFVTRSDDNTAKQTTCLAGAQTMLGKRLYLKASLQQNPLNNENQVVPGRRMLYEAGGQFMGKFTALARHSSEHDDAAGTSLQSNYFGLRGRLSARERVEAVVVFDRVGYVGGAHSRTSYGLEYARELNEDHYLSLKGTVSHDGDPTKAADGRKAYRFDLGYKKAI